MGGLDEAKLADQWKDAGAASPDPVATTPAYPPTTAPQASALGDIIDFTPSFDISNTQTRSEPGLVLASKEFEDELIQFSVAMVASSGRMPPDETIKAKAKEISGQGIWQSETTPVDNPKLLTRFKQVVIDRVKTVLGAHDLQQQPLKPFQQYLQHTQLQPSAERGMDAIDLGLLPALDAGTKSVTETKVRSPKPVVHIAISEKRLEEIIGEIGRGGG